MNLRDMGAHFDTENAPPSCVLAEPLDQYFNNLNEFTAVVQALWFDSGPSDSPTARSYVFYFFRGGIDENKRPDDMLTFKVKLNNPSKVHIVDKYLGGSAYGVVNAPALSRRHLWRPGFMSEEGKQEFMKGFSKESKVPEEPKKSGGCFIATAVYGSSHAPEVTILREFRDEVLLKSRFGQWAVSFYYSFSPSVADFLKHRTILKSIVKTMFIDPVVWSLRIYKMM